MTARYRLLACDIDLTLVRFPDPPSPRVVEAVRAAAEAGVTVVLVTGRAYRRARPIAASLGLSTPIVCNHGGSVRGAEGHTLHRETLARPLVLEIVTWLQGRDVHTLLFDGDRVYHNCTTEEVVPDFRTYTSGPQSIYAPDLRPLVPAETEVLLNTSTDHAHLARTYEEVRARWGDRARVLFEHPHGLDVLPQCSKAAALSWLADYLGIAREEVIAIGDGGNDADMLVWAGLGVAMGNAVPAARAAADAMAPTFKEDGAAWAIERYLLAS